MTPAVKYSDLILKGMEGTLQTFNSYYTADKERNITHTCAVGAARRAAGDIVAPVWPAEDQVWNGPLLECGDPNQIKIPPSAPVHGCVCRKVKEPHFHLKSVVIHLNDCMKWSREKIAEYIASYGY